MKCSRELTAGASQCRQ